MKVSVLIKAALLDLAFPALPPELFPDFEVGDEVGVEVGFSVGDCRKDVTVHTQRRQR